jgi:hypothetical protein
MHGPLNVKCRQLLYNNTKQNIFNYSNNLGWIIFAIKIDWECFTFLYFPPHVVLGLEGWHAFCSGWKQFQAYIIQFFESLSLYCLWSVQMALELGKHCLLLESILGPDGWILFWNYRHFPFWIPQLTDYQPMILNIPAELRPHLLNYYCPSLSYFAYLVSGHRLTISLKIWLHLL